MFQYPKNLFWILIGYLPVLWLYSIPWTGDQKVYIATALEMFQKGEWRYPVLFDQWSFIKPPLQYWATMTSWNVLGFHLFSTLLPSVLCLVVTAIFLSRTAILLGVPKNKTLSGLLFAATVGALTFGTTAQMEIYLAMFFTISWWAVAKYFHTGRSNRYLYIAFVVAGLSGLIKSPLYSALWVLSFVFYLLIRKDFRIFRTGAFYLAGLSGVLVGVAWYAYVYMTNWEPFFHEFLMKETWMKQGGNGLSVLGLWTALIQYGLPMSLFLIPLGAYFWKNVRSPVLLFAVSWMVGPGLFFSYFPYRVSTYLFLTLPALVLLVDWGFAFAGQKGLLRIARLQAIVLGAAGVGLLIAYGMVPMVQEVSWVYLLLFFCVLGFFVYFSWTGNWARYSVSVLGVFLVVRLVTVSLGEKDLEGLRAVVDQNGDRDVIFYSAPNHVWHEFALLGAALGRPTERWHSALDLASRLKKGGILVFSPEAYQERWPQVEKVVGSEIGVTVLDWERWPKKKDLRLKGMIGASEAIPKRNYKLVLLN